MLECLEINFMLMSPKKSKSRKLEKIQTTKIEYQIKENHPLPITSTASAPASPSNSPSASICVDCFLQRP